MPIESLISRLVMIVTVTLIYELKNNQNFLDRLYVILKISFTILRISKLKPSPPNQMKLIQELKTDNFILL